ncbi:MAG TPA: RagB/SusD family nutrient uptake outer membrane protein [Gemmatimonadaceae bacterium]|nr:RagB/SusD family nutrient uptake outer membrane protein [Gemmatimonadaceae bacterium]
MHIISRCALAFAAVLLGACNLDLKNPNSPTEGEVTGSADATIGLATGLQGRFAQSYGNFAYMAGLVTDEFASASAALISISDAEQGIVSPGAGIADNVFNSIYRTVRTADELIAGSDALADALGVGTRSGLRALAFTLKAESLGQALQSYQRIPIRTFGVATPSYVPRSESLPYVRALLDSAATEIAANAPSPLFNSTILTPGVNLTNTINLFRARYARMANDYPSALAFSNLVARSGPTAFSALTFPAPGVNFFNNVTGGTQGIAPRRQYRTAMEAGDRRFIYFVDTTLTPTGRVQALLFPFSRYASPQAVLPVYFPDEALLIKAEALANTGQLAQAQAVVDSVRTDCTGNRGIDDPKACLSALSGTLSQAQLITEIYNQRRFELFATGLRWEDARRRNLVRGPVAAPGVPLDAQRCWLPYAIGDRNANPEVPADPPEPTGFPAGCTY